MKGIAFEQFQRERSNILQYKFCLVPGEVSVTVAMQRTWNMDRCLVFSLEEENEAGIPILRAEGKLSQIFQEQQACQKSSNYTWKDLQTANS